MYGLGCPHGPLKSAPHFSTLKMFGGDLDIEKFREGNKGDVGPANPPNGGVAAHTNEPSGIKVLPFQAEDNRQKLWEINHVSTKNDPLRLKRQKPLKRDQNNLETILGLKRKS